MKLHEMVATPSIDGGEEDACACAVRMLEKENPDRIGYPFRNLNLTRGGHTFLVADEETGVIGPMTLYPDGHLGAVGE